MDCLILPKLNVGRPRTIVHYTHVEYEGKEYTVGHIYSKCEYVKFLINKEDFNEVNEYHWHITANTYVSDTLTVLEDDTVKRKAFYLHNLIMKRDAFHGKGQSETVDHITRNPLDNRRENLRILSQSDQNVNQRKKARTIQLPEGSPIRPEDIPRHIWYVRANGNHGDRFAIEFKTEGICWKTTSSKSVSLDEKLKQAKTKLKELYGEYQYLDPDRPDPTVDALKQSYDRICSIAKEPPTLARWQPARSSTSRSSS